MRLEEYCGIDNALLRKKTTFTYTKLKRSEDPMMKVLPILAVMLLGTSAMVLNGLNSTEPRQVSGKVKDFPQCPGHSTWYKLGHKCVKHFREELDFQSAEGFCHSQKDKSHLISIHSSQENKDVDVFAQTFSRDSPRIWLGGFTVSDPLQVAVLD
ncbi:unnamed protein product [Oncorhynchus mykiss]|uniref:C-type lectin domain-containing protein n=1 Tax=Oncorhynchus mykiss TaxID=8022 RepID=A0A060VSG3_ONCMY|nr:unnamed protein product [Oncorhynchus mykiss]